jgi:hypothetical protein
MRITFTQLLLLASLLFVFKYAAKAQTPDANHIVYVNKNVLGGDGSGNSWTNAITELADAFIAAKNNTNIQQIWVAGGTYKPLYRAHDIDFGTPGGRLNAFLLVVNVKIYGGFAGTETTLSQRDLTLSANKSILSGDLNDNDDPTITGGQAPTHSSKQDNAYHIIVSVNDVGTAELNGFTITGANANGGGVGNGTIGGRLIYDSRGGAMHIHTSSPTLNNLNITNNTAGTSSFSGQGGAMYIDNSAIISPPPLHISNSTFSKNYGLSGGAMYNVFAVNLRIHNVSFIENSAQDAGAILNYSSNTIIANCTFKNNVSSGYGGAIYNWVATHLNPVELPKIYNTLFVGNNALRGAVIFHRNGSDGAVMQNCTVYGNNANNGWSSIHVDDGELNINNSIFWGNTGTLIGTNKVLTASTVPSIINWNYNLITGNTTTTNNNLNTSGFTTTQLFTDATNGDFTLKDRSPAINKGSNALYATSGNLTTDKDLAGNDRLQKVAIDIGAYESAYLPDPEPNANNVIWVNKSVSGGNGAGSNWANAIPDLAHALKWARQQTGFSAGNPLKIYVAKGTYKPMYNAADGSFTTDGGRNNAFVMVNNVQLYGGFAGTENTPAERDLKQTANKSILSGDINGDDETNANITANTDNVNHVVISVGNPATTILDWFTITGGNANTASTITVGTQIIQQDRGAGIYNRGASLKISNCTISGHISTADNGGAGLYNYLASPLVVNTLFTGNKTSGNASGAAIYNHYSTPKFLNITVSGNNATGNQSAALYNNVSPSEISNSLVYGNSNGIVEQATYATPLAYRSPTVSLVNSSGNTWNNPNNAFTADNSYANSSYTAASTVSTSQNLALRGFNHNIPLSATILGIEVEIDRAASHDTNDNYSRDLSVRIVRSSVMPANRANTTGNWPTTRTTATYGSSSDLWGTTSNGTGNTAPITAADINLANFGVIIMVTSGATGSPRTTVDSYIYNARIKVYYTVDGVSTVSYSSVQGGFAGTGNLDTDPLFLGPIAYASAPILSGNYGLHYQSTTIGSGSNALYTGTGINLASDKDLSGNTRLFDAAIDMGAYEHQGQQAAVLSDFTNIAKTFGDADFVITPPNSNSDGAFSYTSGNTSVAIINGNSIQIVGAGTATITANQTATAGYTAGSIGLALTVSKAGQTISFAALAPKTIGTADFALNATATSGLRVSYTSSDNAVAEVYQDATDGNKWKVKIKGTGTTGIIALQGGDANYDAAGNVVQGLVVIDAVLPVQLTSYSVKIEGDYAKLYWQISSGKDNKGFIVYRSNDNKKFIKIGKIDGVGTTSATSDHSFVDKKPLNGNNYYKLVQVDLSGKEMELGIRNLAFNFETIAVDLYPNPTQSKVKVTFATEKYSALLVSNAEGRMLNTIRLKGQDNEIEIDLSQYPTGIYFINLRGERESITKKVIYNK